MALQSISCFACDAIKLKNVKLCAKHVPMPPGD